jgi:hypothetical protein
MASTMVLHGMNSSRSRRGYGLAVRLLLLLLFTGGIVLWLAVLQQARQDVPFLSMLIASVAVTGIAWARCSTRLSGRTRPLQPAAHPAVLDLAGLPYRVANGIGR